jgi:hypothetical protein
MQKGMEPRNLASYFARRLKGRPPERAAEVELESYSQPTAREENARIDTSLILEQARTNLYRIIEDYLGNEPGLKELADKILAEGGEPLKAVADSREDYPWDKAAADTLEVIVQVNGSRPSFLIEDGLPDLASSPIGDWNGSLTPCPPALKKAIACVGRIDRQGQHLGTGFLVGPDLIVTNRHVLQGIAKEDAGGKWTLYNDISIDFGKELKGLASYNRREVNQVVFCGDRRIEAPIDHQKLDLALLLLDTATPFTDPVEPFPLLPKGNWSEPGNFVFVIGYPGDPRLAGQLNYGNDLLERLFHSTYGCKRIAPGDQLGYSSSTAPWTLTHDATTLGGNSGSVMVVVNNEFAAAGLHYGGSLDAPRQNWGHNLSMTLDQTNTRLTPATLGECLKAYG